MTFHHSLKILGSILSLSGGIVAFFASISYFFEGSLMSHFDYNKIGSQTGEQITVIGIFVFIIAVTTIVLSIFSIKRERSKILFLSLIVAGALLLALLPFEDIITNVIASFIASILILTGGILGEISNEIK